MGNLGPVNWEVRTEWGDVRSAERVVGSMVDFRSNCWWTGERELKKFECWADGDLWKWRLPGDAILDKDKPKDADHGLVLSGAHGPVRGLLLSEACK